MKAEPHAVGPDELACRTLLHFLAKSKGDDVQLQQKRATLLNDFCWRVQKLDGVAKASALSRACLELLPENVLRSIDREALDVETALQDWNRNRRQRCDVAIVTVIRLELEAVLRILGRPHDCVEDLRVGNAGFWFGELESESGTSLSVVVTFVGQARNVPCANTVGQLMSRYEVGLMVIVGVAAGVRGKTQLGDVVYAERIYDYEHVRRELRWWGRILPPFAHAKAARVQRERPELWSAPLLVTETLERCNWGGAKNLYSRLVGELEDAPSEAQQRVFEVHDGTIAAGEKLFADGSLHRMFREFDQRIRAGDQEDSGFVQASEFYGAPWAVFRGVCDYGDPSKGARWHSASALAAAACARTFLTTVWAGAKSKLTKAS